MMPSTQAVFSRLVRAIQSFTRRSTGSTCRAAPMRATSSTRAGSTITRQ